MRNVYPVFFTKTNDNVLPAFNLFFILVYYYIILYKGYFFNQPYTNYLPHFPLQAFAFVLSSFSNIVKLQM